MSNQSLQLSNNLNAIGELVKHYGFAVVAHYLAEIGIEEAPAELRRSFTWKSLYERTSSEGWRALDSGGFRG